MKKIPLLIHLMFHPQSGEGRRIAMTIQDKLSGGTKISGLRIPTVIVPEDGSNYPPLEYSIDEAERNVVIVLADDMMALEMSLSDGRQQWSDFIGDIWEKCEREKARFIPIQLAESGWPLDDRLGGVSFLRGHLKDKDERADWIARSLVIEMCRYLQSCDSCDWVLVDDDYDDDVVLGEDLPLKIFISHAKQDIDSELRVYQSLVDYLSAEKPVKAWVDSGEIQGGTRFEEAIEKGVSESALMVVVTDNYSDRTWCRKEILLAKKHQRPFIIVNALEDFEYRSFPYSGNAPTVRWNERGAVTSVDLLLLETLRYLHANLMLSHVKNEDDIVLSVAPELATLRQLGIENGAKVLYPDPPLGDEEIELMSKEGIVLETPLQRVASDQSLKDKKVLISISDSSDAEENGLANSHMTSALVEVSRHLLARGAVLEYGGHLKDEGYTMLIYDMLGAYRTQSGLPDVERIVCDIGWPLPFETEEVRNIRAENKYIATYHREKRPEGVMHLDPVTLVEEPAKFFPADTAQRRYAWARGMTTMREHQAAQLVAGRVVIGGVIGDPSKWYLGRIAGVVEEVVQSLNAKQPVYLIGAYGGATKMMIDLIMGKHREEFTWDYQKRADHAVEMRKIYKDEGVEWLGYKEMTRQFIELGVAGLSVLNGLSEDENFELFETRNMERMIELILKGMLNLE